MGEVTSTGRGPKGSLPPKAKCKAMTIKKINAILERVLITSSIMHILSSPFRGKFRRVKHDAKAPINPYLLKYFIRSVVK
jgi:hypothetical protein